MGMKSNEDNGQQKGKGCEVPNQSDTQSRFVTTKTKVKHHFTLTEAIRCILLEKQHVRERSEKNSTNNGGQVSIQGLSLWQLTKLENHRPLELGNDRITEMNNFASLT